MTPHLLTLRDVDHSLAAQWRALEDVVETRNPFFSRDFLKPAAEHLPDAKQLQLLVGEDAGGLAWLIPLVPSRRLGRMPMVRGVRNRWPHVFFGQPLVAPGRETAAAAALLRHLSSRRGTHWMRLQHLDAQNPFSRALLQEIPAASLHIERYSRGFAVRRTEPTYLDGHSNLRRLMRQRRAFERKSGQTVQLVDHSRDASALEKFLLLEASGWKGRQDSAFLNHSWDADFLRQVCASFRERGDLRLWSLQAGDDIVAMKLNLGSADTVFCYLIAYDENRSELSPGLQLEAENFRLFHAEQRFVFMDSCAAPDNNFVNRLYPERRHLLNVTVGSGITGRTVASLATYSRR